MSTEHYLLEAAAVHLLDHRIPEDVPFVLFKFFKRWAPDSGRDHFLSRLMDAVGAKGIFDSLTKQRGESIISAPREVLEITIENHPMVDPGSEIFEEIIAILEEGRYKHLPTVLMFDAKKRVQSRFSDYQNMDHLSEILEYDALCFAFLEELTKRSSVWKHVDRASGGELVSAVIACFCSILERGGYFRALQPDATFEDLMIALKKTGPALPESIQDRISDLSPINELRDLLTEDLLSWGDIWTVRLMGRIGAHAFVQDLVRVIREADSLSYIHSDAVRAMISMDASAHEDLLSSIHRGDLTDPWDIFPLLEHLPYPESFDMAKRLWNKGEMDSFETYALCLERIGDSRGIEALQEIFSPESSVFIGDSLEVLSEIHKIEIPELPTIRQEREARLEIQKKRKNELDNIFKSAQKQRGPGNEDVRPPLMTVHRRTPKIGRNDPCPCGSGKKYKKCCLK